MPSSWCRRLQENDLIVATPDLWSMVVDTPAAMPSRFTAVSSTAPLNPKTAHALLALYPGITLTEVYGSSETAGIAWRQNHSSQFTLLPYWELLQQGSDWVLKDKQHGTGHVLNDRLEQLDSDAFVVRGRRDRMVQIGGHNIDLAELEKRLCTHSDVREAHVRSEQCDSGVVLHYFLALKSLPNKPINWCPAFSLWLNAVQGDLPPPASVVIGDEIPVGTLDKKISWQHTDYPVCPGVYHLSR
jgi:4-coumarate--CoA ligase